jgi:hypothetical protein
LVERLDMCHGHELIGHNHISEKTYSEALKQWGELTLVGLLTLWLLRSGVLADERGAHAGPAT